jgi:hypothetical protein
MTTWIGRLTDTLVSQHLLIDTKGENKMRSSLKWILLGIYLIIAGLGLLGVFGGSPWDLIAGICAVIAGILFLINR